MNKRKENPQIIKQYSLSLTNPAVCLTTPITRIFYNVQSKEETLYEYLLIIHK